MNFKTLEKLINTHSVTSNTSHIKNLIKELLSDLNVEYFEDGFGSILAGNIASEIMFTAHVDEVGFQVAQINDNGTVRILPIGDLRPSDLHQQVVYIQTEKEKVLGAIFSNTELRQHNIEKFSELFLDLGVHSKKEVELLGVIPGQTGTFKKEFFKRNGTIFATSLDNKISVFALLETIKNNPEFLNKVLIAFHIDEEMQNHSANSLTVQFKPEFAVNLDYFPVHQKPGDNDIFAGAGSGSIVFYRGGNHIIHEEIRSRLDKLENITRGFISSTTMDSLEPQNYENNGRTKAVNLAIPARGYHGGIYTVRVKDIEHFIDSILQLLTVLGI